MLIINHTITLDLLLFVNSNKKKRYINIRQCIYKTFSALDHAPIPAIINNFVVIFKNSIII